MGSGIRSVIVLLLSVAFAPASAQVPAITGAVTATPQTYLTAGLGFSSIKFDVQVNQNVVGASGHYVEITSNVNLFSSSTYPIALTASGTEFDGTTTSNFATFTAEAISATVLRISPTTSATILNTANYVYAFTVSSGFDVISAYNTGVNFDYSSSLEASSAHSTSQNIDGWVPGAAIVSMSFANVPSDTDPSVGDSITSFEFTFSLANDASSTEFLFIKGAQDWLGTNPPLVEIVASTNANVVGTNVLANGKVTAVTVVSTQVLKIEPIGSQPISAGVTQIKFTQNGGVAGNELVYPSTYATQQHFTVTVGTGDPATAVTPGNSCNRLAQNCIDSGYISNVYTTRTLGGLIAGDPIAYFGDKRVEFNLPTGGGLTSLLETPDMHVSASSFDGNSPGEQWIDRVVVSTFSGEKVTDISIKNNLMYFDRTRLKKNAFETLNVVMWDHVKNWKDSVDAKPTELTTRPMHNEYFEHPKEGLSVAFASGRHCRNQSAHIPCQECAHVVSQFAKLLVCSASAHEYYNSGYGAYKYAHLDVEFFDLRTDLAEFKGVLPEIWGIIPRSNETQGMIKSQVDVENTCVGTCIKRTCTEGSCSDMAKPQLLSL